MYTYISLCSPTNPQPFITRKQFNNYSSSERVSVYVFLRVRVPQCCVRVPSGDACASVCTYVCVYIRVPRSTVKILKPLYRNDPPRDSSLSNCTRSSRPVSLNDSSAPDWCSDSLSSLRRFVPPSFFQAEKHAVPPGCSRTTRDRRTMDQKNAADTRNETTERIVRGSDRGSTAGPGARLQIESPRGFH